MTRTRPSTAISCRRVKALETEAEVRERSVTRVTVYPSAVAASEIAARVATFPVLVRSNMTTPMERKLPRLSARAAALGR